MVAKTVVKPEPPKEFFTQEEIAALVGTNAMVNLLGREGTITEILDARNPSEIAVIVTLP